MRNKELMVGVFATVTILILYVGWYFLKGVDLFSSTAKYYVIYDNVDNLAVSNQVQVSGFAVGRVSQIQIMKNKIHSVLVEIDIDSELTLSDSTKAILNSELLGGKYIQLSIGDMSHPIKPGDTISSEVAKGMFDVLTEATQPVASDLQSTLRKFNVVIDNLGKNSQRLDSIFTNLQKTPDLLNATIINTNGKIDMLSSNYNDVALNLSSTLADLKPTLRNFAILSDSLKRMELNKTLLKARQTLNGVTTTLDRLKKGDNTASRLLTEDSLYVNMNKLLLRMDSLMDHINNYPKHFTAPLGKSHKKVVRDLKRDEERKAEAAAAAAKDKK